MLFHPKKLQLATTGDDGLMKIWVFVEENPTTSILIEKEREKNISFLLTFL